MNHEPQLKLVKKVNELRAKGLPLEKAAKKMGIGLSSYYYHQRVEEEKGGRLEKKKRQARRRK